MRATEFRQIPKDAIDDIPTTHDLLVDRIRHTKEQLYADVIRAIINREPLEADFKEVSILTNPNYPTQELISYKDNTLGRILFAWEQGFDGSRITFTFEPIPTFK